MTGHDDDLRTRLSALDPMPASVPVDPSTSPRARELLERAVQTPMQVEDRNDRRVWRKPGALAAAVIAVVALGVGVVIASSGDNAAKPKAKTTLALKVASHRGGPGIQSCIQFSVEQLKTFPVAFGATVTTVTDSAVTLTVDRWYKGGNADVVTLARTSGDVGLEGGTDFAVGKHYLVTASDGTVTSCGFSGESTPDLERAFAEAFPG